LHQLKRNIDMSKTKNPTIDRHMPEAVHHVADRLKEARRLLAEADTTASALWSDYQTALRQNAKDTQTPRSAWETACADKQSRALAVELLEADLRAVLRDLAEGAHRPGSPFRDAQTEDHRAQLAAEGARRELVAEAVGLLERAARTGTEEAACPRTGAALAEFAALAELVPDVAEEVTTRARVPRYVSAGCVPVVENVLAMLRNVAAPVA